MQERRYGASATVEAAIVMPIFIYGVMTIMFILQIISVRRAVDMAVYNNIRSLSKYSYVIDSDNGSQLLSEAALYAGISENLGAGLGKNNYIIGGNYGVSILGSEILKENNTIKVKVNYVIKNPFDIFGLALIHINQTYENEAWRGIDTAKKWDESQKEQETVFVTKYGTVYHKSMNCAYLDLSIRPVEICNLEQYRNESGGKYARCELCLVGENGIVYITNYGEKYHGNLYCSGLSRYISEVPLSSVKGKSVCRKCG